MANKLTYSINGTPFNDFGVIVESSRGVVDMLARKPSIVRNWADYHGEQIDLTEPIFEPRNIVLECAIISTDPMQWFSTLRFFQAEFAKANLQRLMIEYLEAMTPAPLVYEVYLSDGIEMEKRWRNGQMYGRFSLKLREPEPIKKVVRFIGAVNGTVEFTTNTPVNIYWGDGTKTLNQKGTISLSHTYTGASDKYAIITGMVNKITGFTTNGQPSWEILQ